MDKVYRNAFYTVILFLGLVWLKSTLGKLTAGKFVDSLSPTLEKFTSGNPHPWYIDFVENSVMPNSKFFGNLIMWGEFLTAISLISSSIYFIFSKKDNKILEYILVLGLLGGALLNLNFWFASGWMSPSGDSLNLLMFAIQVLALLVFGKKLLKK